MTAALNNVDFPPRMARLHRSAQGSDRPRSGNGRGHSPVVGEAIRQRFGGVVPDALGLYGQGSRGWRGCPAGQVSRSRGPRLPGIGLWELEGDYPSKTLYYHPEAATAAKRFQSVQQWQRQLQTGRIRFYLPDAKPRSTPAARPPKGTIPEPPKPLNGGAPSGSAAHQRDRADRAGRSADRGGGRQRPPARTTARQRSRAGSSGKASANCYSGTATGNWAVGPAINCRIVAFRSAKVALDFGGVCGAKGLLDAHYFRGAKGDGGQRISSPIVGEAYSPTTPPNATRAIRKVPGLYLKTEGPGNCNMLSSSRCGGSRIGR